MAVGCRRRGASEERAGAGDGLDPMDSGKGGNSGGGRQWCQRDEESWEEAEAMLLGLLPAPDQGTWVVRFSK